MNVLPLPVPYPLFVCLALYEETARLKLSWAVKEGIELALGKGEIPLKYFLAVCKTREEAERRSFRANVARKEAAFGMG